jgi:hypothetical protein
MSVFGDSVVRKICGPNRDEGTEEWRRKLHNEKLYDPHSSTNSIQVIQVGEACSTNVGKSVAHRVVVRKPEGKRRLGRCRCRGEDNIKMNHL